MYSRGYLQAIFGGGDPNDDVHGMHPLPPLLTRDLAAIRHNSNPGQMYAALLSLAIECRRVFLCQKDRLLLC